MLDLKIVGGVIVDGSGAPRRRGDVGVRDGRIVAVGDVPEDARETVDATGRIVVPGFVDVHTHYDAQVFWDPALSPSCFHGVTTVIGGFCGFSIAPLTPEAAEYLAPMLARVEGMPVQTLLSAVPWNWRSFGEYLDTIEGKVGLNAGFFAGHSAIRRVVMGERAVGQKATPEDVEAMKALLGQSLAEGALGFSTSIAVAHFDGDGQPVPSRWADFSEIVALGDVVRDYEGTGLELLPDLDFGPGIPELMTDFSVAGQRAVNWNALGIMGHENARKLADHQLSVSNFARERGGEVIALTVPVSGSIFMNLKSGFVFDSNPGIWAALFRMPVDKRIEAFRDPEIRRQMQAGLDEIPLESFLVFRRQIDRFTVVSVVDESNRKYEGRLVGEIAAEGNRTPLDVMLDIAIADGLVTTFAPATSPSDAETFRLKGEIWLDDRTLIGASDAGAHLDMIDIFSFSTGLLQQGVREHGVITFEEAVYQITDRAARYFGLIDRGLLKAGYHADIVILDEATVGRGPTYFRYDVPGNEPRTYADAIGIEHVFVNGVEVVRHGEHTGKLPGKVLRSGKDTRTVPLDAMHEGRQARLLETA